VGSISSTLRKEAVGSSKFLPDYLTSHPKDCILPLFYTHIHLLTHYFTYGEFNDVVGSTEQIELVNN
jgi:hypothetical protein